jgi:hypothetical protein
VPGFSCHVAHGRNLEHIGRPRLYQDIGFADPALDTLPSPFAVILSPYAQSADG